MTLYYDDGEGGEEVKNSEHMRYLGVLGLLCELSVHAPEDLRDCIDDALADACEADPKLRARRILNRRELEVIA